VELLVEDPRPPVRWAVKSDAGSEVSGRDLREHREWEEERRAETGGRGSTLELGVGKELTSPMAPAEDEY